jgi:surface polysaccharide O-acyltransferase-like enzyme
MKKERIEWLDTLRAIAIIAVVLVHTSTPVVKMIYGVNMPYWWIGNVYDSMVRFCVPAFLMLTGATLLGRDYQILDFYQKRLMRIAVPFAFWFVAYLVFNWAVLRPHLQPHGFENIMHWAFQLIIDKGVSTHFWYLYMILVLYAVMPLINALIKRLNEKSVLLLLGFWFLLNILYVAGLFKTDNFWIGKATSYTCFAGYMILGFYLAKKDFQSIKTVYLLLLFLLTVVIASFATFYLSKLDGKLNQSFYTYLHPNTIFQAIAVFLLSKRLTINNRLVSRLRDVISDYSFGIYFVHIMVIGVFFLNGFFWTMAHPIVSVPIVTVSVLVVSWVIIFMLRKIPFGKYVSG